MKRRRCHVFPHVHYAPVFTGIIEAIGRVEGVQQTSSGGIILSITRPDIYKDIVLGSSICVAGVCLTVTKLDPQSMTFDIVPTTMQKSRFSALQPGELLNLERAMRADGRFDGHIVQGHCEGIGTVIDYKEDGDDVPLSVKIPRDLLPYIVLRGCITLDGVSLTVADLKFDILTVALVPFTRKYTTLGALKIGVKINIETDILARYILSSHGK